MASSRISPVGETTSMEAKGQSGTTPSTMSSRQVILPVRAIAFSRRANSTPCRGLKAMIGEKLSSFTFTSPAQLAHTSLAGMANRHWQSSI